MMRKSIGILLVLAISFGFATTWADDKEMAEGRGFFMVGMHKIDVGDLNTALTNNGYGKFEDNFLSMGGCGYAILKDRFIIGGEGHGLFGDKQSMNGYDVSLMGGYGMFNLGIVAVKKSGFMLYPLLGIGGAGMSLKIVESAGASFDEILRQPKRGVELNTGGLMLGVALGADYLLILSDKPDEVGGIAIGFRVGYNYSTAIGGWTYEDKEISGGPKIGVTGPYLQFMIGGGGKGK